jgi:hypothetical protein
MESQWNHYTVARMPAGKTERDRKQTVRQQQPESAAIRQYFMNNDMHRHMKYIKERIASV